MLYDDVIFIGLTSNREELYERINKRLEKMAVDLVDEVKLFYLEKNYSKSLMTGIGYKELYNFFDNKNTLQEALVLVKQKSRHYVKRQYTWFENQINLRWFCVNYEDFKKND